MDVHPAPTARTSQPPTHTYTTQNNTMSLTCGGPGWRVVARFKMTCYHVLLTRSTTGCTHLRSGGGGREQREWAGGGGQGTLCECGRRASTHHTNGFHNDHPPTAATSRTAHIHFKCSHAQATACTGHRARAGEHGALDVQQPTQIQTTPWRSPAGAPGGAWSPASS